MTRWLARVGVDNPVLLNLAFLAVLVAGMLAWVWMPKEEFPQVSTDRVIISIVYPGASPADIIDDIARPVEDALDSVSGLKHVYTDATEGLALFTIELVRGTDSDTARNDVDRAVRGVEEMPDDALTPKVSVAELRIPLTHVGLTGDVRQQRLADDLADELVGFPGVGEVRIRGASVRVVEARLDPAEAAARGLTPDAVATALQIAGQGAPAGSVELLGQEVVLSTPATVRTPAEVAALPIDVGDGRTLRLGDIATVSERWEEPLITHRVNGQPAIDLVVLPTSEADALALVPVLQDWARERAETLPAGVGLVAYDDSARLVRARISTLASNGGVGLLLVALTLVVFIGWRNAGLVVWGMPVAWLGAAAAMYAVGVTVNVVSTFGLLLVTGIIVDDAIVIVENVQRHLEQGKNRVQAAVDGAMEVMPAVFAATLTTCLAFAPLLTLEGTIGSVMRNIPMVVILALMASLFEAFVVLPGHLAHFAEERTDGERENLPTRVLKRAYEPLLAWVTKPGRRLLTVGLIVVTILGGGGLAGLMKLSLTTAGDPVFVLVNVDLPPSSDADSVREVLRGLERMVEEEASHLAIYAAGHVGEQTSPQGFPILGPRYGQLKVGFHKDPDVLAEVPAFIERMRAWLSEQPEVTSIGIETLTGGPPAGKDIDVRVRMPDQAELRVLVDEIVAFLTALPGVKDVRSETEQGNERWEVAVDPVQARRFGMQSGQVALATRYALDGALALEIPIAERTTEVRVTLPEPRTLDAVADLAMVTGPGQSVRLRQLGDVQRTRGTERLQRVDSQPAIRIVGEIDDDLTSSSLVKQALDAHFATVSPRYPGASLFYGGQIADSAESFAQLPAAAGLAVLLIYLVLAVQFRSYTQPLIILSVVPLGAVGAILGLFLLNMELSLIAMIGAVGLVGIVVNDSLVLVDFINQQRREGMAVEEAVVTASLTRLRPILITTVTTVLGLMPLALGVAGEEKLLAPMAVSISFGLAFATGLTLVAVPVLYLVLADLTAMVSRGHEAAEHG